MESTIFISATPLLGNGSFPTPLPTQNTSDWDDIINYNSFNINLVASTKCQIYVYQSTPYSTTTIDIKLLNSFLYTTLNTPVIISGKLSSKYVYIIVQNLSSINQTTFNLSVVYK